MNNKINDKNYIPLTPFKGWVLENFPFIEANFDAITNYELICKVTEYLNNVINNQNLVEQLGSELVQGYNNLIDYVNNYFENLDVQTEINNKLDEMVEDGTFENLINNIVVTEIQPQINEQNERISDIETLVESATNGSPKGVYATVSDLQTADPDHNYIYVVASDGHWYYYDGEEWADGGLYQSTLIEAKSIGYEKTNYLDSINLAKYIDNWTSGYHYENTAYSSDNYKYSDRFEVEAGVEYYSQPAIRFIDYYDNNGDYVSTVNQAQNTFTIPSGVKYAIFSIGSTNDLYLYKNYLYRAFVVNQTYENEYFENKNININLLKNNENTYSGYVKKLDIENNTFLVGNGGLITNSTYYTTPFLRCYPNNRYYISSCRFVVYYDKNFKVVGSYADSTSKDQIVKSPNNAYYLKISSLKTRLDDAVFYCIDDYDFNNGNQQLRFSGIPSKIEVEINHDLILYLNDILTIPDQFIINYTYSGNDSHVLYKPSDNTITLSSSSTENATLTLKLYDKRYNLLISKDCNIIFKNITYSNKTALFIGDSTINQNYETRYLQEIYSDNNATLTLLGTRGSGTNKHEGYSGATLKNIVTSPTLTAESLTNPFYHNGTFDFSYYMAQQSYASVDEVFIQFGINDVFGTSTDGLNNNITKATEFVTNLNTVISSIHDFNSSIIININLIIEQNNSDVWYQVYKDAKSYALYQIVKNIFNNAVIDSINTTNVNIVATNIILTHTDINDGVHPNTTGYRKLAEYIKNIM